jgi:hypothetical protein
LIIANENSYYHWMPSESWSAIDLMFWDEDFGRDLGAPMGAATKSGTIYTRSFEHLDVWLDLESKEAVCAWDSVDTDADGLDDLWEYRNFGDLTAADPAGNPDGDAYTNEEEYAAGTNPNVSDSIASATIHWTGGANSNDWNDAASWGTAYVPGTTAADTVLFVGSGDSTTLVTPFAFANASSINLRGGPNVTLEANLSGVNNFYLGGNSNNDGGTVNHLGGTLSVVSLKVGSSSAATSDSTYTISGGQIANSGNLNVNKGTFTLAGSTAEVGAGFMTVTDIGELKFELGSSGVTPISVTNALTINSLTSKLSIDCSGYIGADTVIELIEYGSISGSFAADKIAITGFAEEKLVASVVLGQANGKDCLQLVLTESDYGAWASGHDLSGDGSPMSANPDGDAYTNEEEYIAGLNPNVFDVFKINSSANGNTLEWDAVNGRLYTVYWSSNLVDGFALVESNLVNGIYVAPETDAQGFYKITGELEP